MARFIKFLSFILLLIGLAVSCEVTEGEGGTSSISGKVFVRDFDMDGEFKEEYYGGEWAVYIIYGDDTIYGDRMDTHFDGSYRFSSLYPGEYTIYTYSKCLSCPGEVEVKSVSVILDRNEDLVLEDLVVED